MQSAPVLRLINLLLPVMNIGEPVSTVPTKLPATTVSLNVIDLMERHPLKFLNSFSCSKYNQLDYGSAIKNFQGSSRKIGLLLFFLSKCF